MLVSLRKFLKTTPQKWQLKCSSSQAAVLVFLFSAFGTVSLLWRWERYRLQVERERVSQIAHNYANDLQRSLINSLSGTYALAALVDEYQGTIPKFKSVARELLPLYPAADALGILPQDGEIVVLKENKTDANNSLIEFDDAQGAIANNSSELRLITNGSHAVGYLPIYLESDRGNSFFWGFTAVEINVAEILEDINSKELEELGFSYQIEHIEFQTNYRKVIAKSDAFTINKPIEKTIEIYNATWKLSLSPVVGWNKPIQFSLKIILGLFFSIMLATLVKLFLDSKAHALELEKIAYFDPLTGLPNRRLLLYRLEEIIALTGRNGKKIAVCYLDLDSFQSINNYLGQKAGDYILVRIAKRLQKFLRKGDVVARIGGDEFIIVLQDISEVTEVKQIIKRITEDAFVPISYDTETVSISTSIGVVIYPLDSVAAENSLSTLLGYAERAMYYSKNNKKGSCTFFNELTKTIAETSL